MKQIRLLTLLVLLMTAATGAWATDGIACSASDIGKVLCTDGSIYATVGDATTAQKTAAAMIAYIDATNNKGLAIALADESGTNYEAAGTACSGKAAVTGGTWRLPSDKDWQYMFIGCGSSESYSAPTTAMIKSYSGLASKLTTAQGTALLSDFYWSSTKDEPNGAWGVVFDDSNATFYMEDKTVDHKVRACLAFDVTSTYTVSLNDGTEDADKWSVKAGEGEYQALPLKGVAANTAVSVKYSGEKKVKSVKAVKKGAAPAPASGTDLATITADYEAKDGETLTGTLASNVKISIADGATVTLKDVTITNLGDNCDWAGISSLGDATLVLEGTNTVCAGRGGDGYNNYPGIYIAPDKTLTIQGDGTLTAYSNGTQPYGAGIGGGYEISCGNIVINSGTITATGGYGAAGIGSGHGAGCGNITINGGTVTATGGKYGAGIGSGGDGENYGTCGNITISGGTVEATGGSNAAGIGGGRYNGACGTITITSGVTSVKATKGDGEAESIGKGNGGQDITVNIENGANVTQK